MLIHNITYNFFISGEKYQIHFQHICFHMNHSLYCFNKESDSMIFFWEYKYSFEFIKYEDFPCVFRSLLYLQQKRLLLNSFQ